MPTTLSRRAFLKNTSLTAAALALAPGAFAAEEKPGRTNVLLITADDALYNSFGCMGSKTPDVTPNIDKLAAQGILFEHGHVTSAICQPSRSAIGTGRYPHRSGALGFDPINPGVPTIVQSFKAGGYHTGILSKVEHVQPRSRFLWDFVVGGKDLAYGRGPSLYHGACKTFFEQCRAAGKPFFLMANSDDPHRPFPSSGDSRPGVSDSPVSRAYKPEEVQTPGFLPSGIPDIRKEIAQYCTALHRCDETVGQILRALKESGQEENTIVIFLSDNGISVPFAKTNCYEASTRTPFIIRWPGKIKPGTVDREHLIAGIDLMPTIIDALGLAPVKGMDGRSFLPILNGEKPAGWDKVFTFITRNVSRQEFPMRCVRTKTASYIFNAWSDGARKFRNESMGGLTWKAMLAAGEKDPKIAERCKFFLHRAPEEFHDLESDPEELTNLIDSPKHKPEIAKLRAAMLDMMTSTNDPLLEEFKRRVT